MLTVAARRAAVVQMVGAVAPEVRSLIERNIDAIWSVACRYACYEPLTTLYAQREALDLALAYFAPLVSRKDGSGSGERVSLGRSHAESVGRADGSSQNWSCDWSNTSSYAVHRTDGDGYTRARSATDGETFAYFRQQSWDRSQTQQVSNSRADSRRRSATTRANEQRSAGDGQMDGFSTEGHGRYVYTPTPEARIQHPYQVSILDINIPLADPIPTPDDLPSGIHCERGPQAVGCLSLVRPELDSDVQYVAPSCPLVLTENEVIQRRMFSLPPIANIPNYSVSAEHNVQLYIPIPAVGVVNIGFIWQSSTEQRPRWSTSRTIGDSSSTSQGLSFMRAFSSASSESTSEVRGQRQNDAHTRARGDSTSRNDSRSASLGRQLTFSEVHTGSSTDAHGQGQASTVSESERTSKSIAWQRNVGQRTHQFELQRYSDAFEALSNLRRRIAEQIERLKLIFKAGQFATQRIERVKDVRPYHPAIHTRGYAGTICVPRGGFYAVQPSRY